MEKLVRDLLGMIRFSHTIFALPFAMLAAVMAWTTIGPASIDIRFRWHHLLGLIVCIVAARSAAMAFNRIADIEIDRLNPRTKGRHLPTQAISVRAAAMFTLTSSIAYVAGSLFFFPNWLPLLLSVPILVFLFAYSYAKRFTWLAHVWLGCSLMMAPVATWIAIRGEVILQDWTDVLPAVLLGLGVMFWVTGFDVIYACQDYQFDRDQNLKSIPARFGIPGALRLALFSHLAMLACLVALPLVALIIGPRLEFGWLYWTGIVSSGGLMIYEHWLVSPTDLSRVNVAFFNVNATISVGLFLVGAIDLLFI